MKKVLANRSPRSSKKALVGIVMGSESDYETMQHAEETLVSFDIPYEISVTSAHRTPKLMYEYSQSAKERGLKVIIAGAGGAAHLPGMVSALSTIPVIGVPIQSKALDGLDSLLSIVQMPAGVPTATFAIGKSGAINAALFAVQILALENKALSTRLERYRHERAKQAVSGNAIVQESLEKRISKSKKKKR
jgi:5-(carboxyamino)imidazole ribonucleotide mutase